jgi:hypothetical protein
MPIHPDLQPLLTGETMDVSTLEAASFRAMIAELMAPGEPAVQVAEAAGVLRDALARAIAEVAAAPAIDGAVCGPEGCG